MKVILIIQMDLLSNDINHLLWQNSKVIDWIYPVLPRIGETISFKIIQKHFGNLILGEIDQLQWIVKEISWELENDLTPKLIIIGNK